MLLVLSCTAISASADLTIGGRPSAAMGGAGLALPINYGQQGVVNPSLFAFGRKSLNFNWPSIGYRLDGITISELKDKLGNIDKGGLDSSKLTSYATTFGDSQKSFGINGDLSITASGFGLIGGGEANVTTVPNAALQTWVKGGSNQANLTGTEQLDGYGLGYAQVGLGYGRFVPSTLGKLAVGATIKEVRGYYGHKIVNSAAIATNSNAINGTDVPAGSDTVQKDGVGVDAGVTLNPTLLKSLYAAFVVENLVQPNVKFDYQLPSSAQVINNDINVYGTTYDAGLGFVLSKRAYLAADVIDITNRASRQELRLGASLNVLSVFNVSAGYSSRSHYTLGASAFGIDVIYSTTSPVTVGSAFKF